MVTQANGPVFTVLEDGIKAAVVNNTLFLEVPLLKAWKKPEGKMFLRATSHGWTWLDTEKLGFSLTVVDSKKQPGSEKGGK